MRHAILAPLAACLLSCLAPAEAARAAEGLLACSFAGVDTSELASFERSPERRLACRGTAVATLGTLAGRTLAVRHAEIMSLDGKDGAAEADDGIVTGATLATLIAVEGDAAEPLAAVVVPNGAPTPVFSLIPVAEGAFVSFGEAAAQAFRVAADGRSARIIDAQSWVMSARDRVPAGYVSGRAYRTDLKAMTGSIAAFPEGADDPKTPGSAFEPGHVLVVRLGERGGVLVGTSSEFRPRDPAEVSPDDDGAFRARDEALRIGMAGLPAGTMACDIRGWSADDDPKGLNVRAEPSPKAQILGRLAPPNRSPNADSGSGEGWRTEFRIIGYRAGWFLIEAAEEPGAPYDDPPPAKHPRSYKGRGWVAATMVGAAYASSGMPTSLLRQAPSIDAADKPTEDGTPFSIDGTLKSLLACSGSWGLTEAIDGQRGWWRGICSNQATNCS